MFWVKVGITCYLFLLDFLGTVTKNAVMQTIFAELYIASAVLQKILDVLGHLNHVLVFDIDNLALLKSNKQHVRDGFEHCEGRAGDFSSLGRGDGGHRRVVEQGVGVRGLYVLTPRAGRHWAGKPFLHEPMLSF